MWTVGYTECIQSVIPNVDSRYTECIQFVIPIVYSSFLIIKKLYKETLP